MYPQLAMVQLAPWFKVHATENMLAEQHFIYFGEIPNMPGHGVYFGASGKMYAGYHLDDFEIIPD